MNAPLSSSSSTSSSSSSSSCCAYCRSNAGTRSSIRWQRRRRQQVPHNKACSVVCRAIYMDSPCYSGINSATSTSSRNRRRPRINLTSITTSSNGSGGSFLVELFFWSTFFWVISLSIVGTCTSTTAATAATAPVAAFVAVHSSFSSHHHQHPSRHYSRRRSSNGNAQRRQPQLIPNHHPLQQHSSTSLSSSSSSTSTSSSSCHYDYESLTVKELRQLVKSTPPCERGVLSRLQRKQDLIEYLKNVTTTSTTITTVGVGVGSIETNEKEHAATQTNTKPTNTLQAPPPRIQRMPPLQQKNTNNNNNYSNNNNIKQILHQQQAPLPKVAFLSPKDAIVEQVYQRYPLLQRTTTSNLITTTIKSKGDKEDIDDYDDDEDDDFDNEKEEFLDIRKDHPIFSYNNHNKNRTTTTTAATRVTSDMDLVFIGTASCTPGVTRGVSCTALRLNGKKQRGSVGGYPLQHVPMEPSTTTTTPKAATRKQEAQNSHPPKATPWSTTFSSGFQGGTWLFDVGECTQLQVQRSSSVRPSKITKIFLTHAHGDHSFGLPGLLCLMGQDRDRRTSNGGGTGSTGAGAAAAASTLTSSAAVDSSSSSAVVDIYGPEGLRMWLRVAIRYSVSRIVPPYRVHELHQVPMAPEWEFNARTRRFYYNNRGGYGGSSGGGGGKTWGEQGLAGYDPISWISQARQMPLQPSALYGEMEGGRDIYPIYNHPLSSDGAPVWEVLEEKDVVQVYAAPMSHGIPCVGYVVNELPQPGRLRNELVEPIVKRNIQALKEAGFAIPMKAMAVIKNLPPGSAFTFPDGTVVTQEEAVEPPRLGRKVVICGDTADARALKVLAQDADIVVHEATNTYLPGVDNKDTDLRAITRDAVVHGHSTPYIAGEFCRSVGAKRLILNHFSARYKGDVSVDSLSIMMRIERQAMKASGLNETQVAAAWDLMVLPIPKH